MSTPRLLHALGVFTACTVPPLVKNARHIIELSNKIVGETATTAMLRVRATRPLAIETRTRA
ncbi:hypothetical protein EON67_12525 [archaeon]|nr:MAG: hypothetical protein EON67_12525 [archaeon]